MGKITLVMFDKKAKFKEIKDFHFEHGAAYDGWKKAEIYGKEKGLYGHCITSFNGMNFTEFENHEAFKQQLKYLGWKFNGDVLSKLSY